MELLRNLVLMSLKNGGMTLILLPGVFKCPVSPFLTLEIDCYRDLENNFLLSEQQFEEMFKLVQIYSIGFYKLRTAQSIRRK